MREEEQLGVLLKYSTGDWRFDQEYKERDILGSCYLK